VKTPLTRIREGSYRHERLGVEVEKTPTADFPWQLSGPDPDGSGVVLARTLGDARTFLGEIEERLDLQPDTLLALHRYLFPERYEDVPMYEWHAGTIEDVAAMIERALVNDPRAELSPT
jgi:hypothetical protein